MAFNLNKADQPASKFNLSKGEESPVEGGDKKNSRIRVWIIIVLLVIGGIAWYLLREKPTADNSATASVPAVSRESSVGKDLVMVTGATGNLATKAKADKEPKPVDEHAATVTAVNTLQNSVPGSFDPGSSSLHPDTKVVNDLVEMLSKNSGKRIVITGYASSEGDITVNRQLSAQRAASFKEYLVSKGIDADRITTEAKGIANPIATNDTEEGRRKNRRVQVMITD